MHSPMNEINVLQAELEQARNERNTALELLQESAQKYLSVVMDRDAAYLRAGARWKELDAERQDHGITKRERDGLRRVLVQAMEILWALDASVEWELCDEIKQAIKAAIAAEKQLAN